MRVEKRFKNRSRVMKPVQIIRDFKFTFRAVGHNFAKPLIHRTARQQVLQGITDFLRCLLNGIDLERLVIKAIETILNSPMAFNLRQQFLQFWQLLLDI